LFGFKKKEQSDNVVKEKPVVYGRVGYMGGHKAHPQPTSTQIFFYEDRIELGHAQEKTVLKIPYSSMTNIENFDEKKFAAERAIALGLIGALWKKKHIYTVIHYKDEFDEQKIILDFEDNVQYAQGFIYKKMLEARKNRNENSGRKIDEERKGTVDGDKNYQG
jgi:hypothetical protein